MLMPMRYRENNITEITENQTEITETEIFGSYFGSEFESCYIIDCTIVDYYITYFGPHTYSRGILYVFIFCTIIVYE